ASIVMSGATNDRSMPVALKAGAHSVYATKASEPEAEPEPVSDPSLDRLADSAHTSRPTRSRVNAEWRNRRADAPSQSRGSSQCHPRQNPSFKSLRFIDHPSHPSYV